MNIAILCQLWPGALDELRRRHQCTVARSASVEAKVQAIAGAEIAIVRSPVVLDRKTLEAAPRLRLVIRAGAGLDNIDLAFARERGIRLATVPLSAESVAEHAFGLILSLYRRIPWFHRSLQEGRWEKHAGYGLELCGKTLGLVGFGRIGTRIASIAKAFRMAVIAYDRSPGKAAKRALAAELGVRFVDLEQLFSRADVVSVQVPLDDDTRGLVDARLMGLMRPHAVLLNVGRGGVVDEAALYRALCERTIAGAALDVFASEPPGEHPLLQLDNFVGTPHVGAQTVEAQRKVGEDVVRIVEAFQRGEEYSTS